MRALVLVVGVVLVVAGCGGPDARPAAVEASQATSTPSPAASKQANPRPSTSASTTPARLTVATARTRYLTITRPYNVALERFEKSANGGAGLATLRRGARAVAAANLAESRLLAATNWPTTVVRPVNELIQANTAARRHWTQAANAGSLSEMSVDLRRAVAASGKEPAAEIRRRLGLPAYDEKDYG
jgi:hypothetical protein